MKYILTFLVCSLLSFQGLYGQCGSVRSITWDGGGADELWHNPLNWSSDSVPDCNDNVLFDRVVSFKTCRIGQAALCGNITMRNGAGRLVVGNAAALSAGHLLISGAMFVCTAQSGMVSVTDLTLNFNGYCALANASCSGTITLGNGLFAVCSGKQISTQNLLLQRYANFVAPDGINGIVTILGNLSKDPISTYTPKDGILRFAGPLPLNLNLNSKPLTAFIVEFNKTGSAATQPGSAVSLSKDTLLALRRMSFNEVTFKDQGSAVWAADDVLMVRDTMELATTMGDNTGTFAFHSGTGTLAPLTLAFTGIGNSCFIQKQSGGIVGRHRLLVHKAAPANEVRLRGLQLLGTPSGTIYERIRIEQGRLMFEDSVNAIIRVVTGTSDKSTVGLYVGEQGALCAPDGDTLDFSGTWELRDSSGWQMKRGTFRLQAAGVCFSNGKTLRFHHLDMAARTSSLNLSDGAAHIAGNLVLSSVSTSSSNGTVRGGTLFLEGNYTSFRTSGSNPTGNPLCFVGSRSQQVRNPLPGELARGIVMQKSGGAVRLLDSAAPLARLEFKGGILLSDKMLQTSGGFLFGGSETSFLHGRLMLLNSGNDNLNILFPIGKGSVYRPLRITHTATIGSSRTWIAEYFAANPAGTPRGSCLKAPLDSLSVSGYWFVNNNFEGSSTRYHLPASGNPYSASMARMARWDSLQKCWVNRSTSGVGSGWLSSSGNLGTAKTAGYHYLAVANAGASNPPEDNDHEISAAQNLNPMLAWSLYPNPMSGSIRIRIPGAARATLEFKDLSGRLLHAGTVADEQQVDVAFLPAGIYVLTLSDGRFRCHRTCVKL